MRISNTHLSRMMMDSINQRMTDYAKLNRQLTTGKRVNDISDDPIASMQMVLLENSKSCIGQYQTNISRLSGHLTVQEASLTSVDNQLLALRDKLLAAKNGNHSAEQSATFGSEIKMLLEGMVADLNTQNTEGNYLFSGTKSDTQPVTWDSASQRYIYHGNSDSRETVIGNGVTLKENTHLSSAFSAANNDLSILTSLKQLADKMVDPSIKPASYSQNISDMLGAVKTAAGDLGSMLTDLGARQNRLERLADIHSDIEIVNANLEKDLVGVDIFKVNAELESNMLSTKITHSVHAKMSQLSLFNYI